MASKLSRDGFHGSKVSQQTTPTIANPTAVTVATANGSDAGTTQTLANALKVQINAVIADNVALRAQVAALLLVVSKHGLCA